ncbi:MAG: signal peptide peptidase SppA [Myxococcota bacterium]
MVHRLSTSLLALLLLSGCILYAPVDLGAFGSAGELEESIVLGTTGPKIALIEVTGVITEEEERARISISQRPNIVVETKNALDRAADDPDVAGVLLRINTPGGSVSASDTIHHEIEAWKSEQKRPVVAYLNGLATSGGYYVAMASDRVVSHPTAVTGSIGVVMPGLSIEGLMEKYGVADQTLTSGPYKDAGSLLRDMTPEERTQLSSVISDLFARFEDVVAKGRPGLTREKIASLSDGRVYSAQQALDAGLVDQLGYLEDAVAEVEKAANISESRVVVYHRSNQTRENIYSRTPNVAVQVTDVNLLPIRRSELAPGFYYLWPGALAP